MKSITLELPESFSAAVRLPPAEIRGRLLQELALSFYSQGLLPLAKAAEVAELDRHAFGILLGERSIPRHYTCEELEEDLRYGRGQ